MQENNKSALIREALEKGKETPAEISAYILETYQLEVNPKYISVVKSHLKNGRRKGSKSQSNPLVNYVISSGSTERAIEKLQSLQEDKNLVEFLVFAGDIKTAISMIEEAKKKATN